MSVIVKGSGGGKTIFPTGIAITTPPTTVEYEKDDALDLSGIVVTGTFDNGVVVDITDECTFSPADGTILTGNETAVTVSFLWGSKTYTTTQAITVKLLKIVTWAGGTDDEIVAMVKAADRGKINLSDYWAVGDTRTVRLSAMDATGVSESHSAQEVDLVLMHAGGYKLNTAVASGRTTCSFIVGQKDSLATKGYMNSSNTNSSSWHSSARRTWCNNVYKNALPSTLLPIFKQFETITAHTYNGTNLTASPDYFALPAVKEVFGGDTASSPSYNTTYQSNLTEFNALFQFDYYKTTSNRVKKLGKTDRADGWWVRSPYYNNSTHFCRVYLDGTANNDKASYSFGLAPFGCI